MRERESDSDGEVSSVSADAVEAKKPLIQSLERALDIVEIVRDADGPMRSADVARRMGLRTATANNILRTLYQRGYLAQDDSSRYVLGSECFKLYSQASDRFTDLRRVVSEPVRELSERTGDTAFFGCEYYGSVYCVSMSIGGGQLVVSPQQSWVDQLHCTASGKIIIAEHGIDWYAEQCRRRPPRALTARTLVTVDAMAAEIGKIHEAGYALSIGECAEEIAALGIAVRDRTGAFVGALAQTFPAFYLESGRIDPVRRVEALRTSAARISHDL